MNPAGDIIPGSTWPSADESSAALVVSVRAGYVLFDEAATGEVRTLYHARFREAYRAPYDARELRSQFTMSLKNLVECHVFVDAKGKMYARSAKISPDECYTAARGRPALPPDARLIGTYNDVVIAPQRWQRAALTPWEVFIGDLHDAIRRFCRRPASI